MKAGLKNQIDNFLKNRRPSVKGGWAQLTKEDMQDLKYLIDELIAEKCEPDADGDYPINFLLVNRLVFEPIHFLPIPYSFKQPDEALDTAIINSRIASEKLEQAWKEIQRLTRFGVRK